MLPRLIRVNEATQNKKVQIHGKSRSAKVQREVGGRVGVREGMVMCLGVCVIIDALNEQHSLIM